MTEKEPLNGTIGKGVSEVIQCARAGVHDLEDGTRWLCFPTLSSLGAKKFNKKEKTDSIMTTSDCKILALIVC